MKTSVPFFENPVWPFLEKTEESIDKMKESLEKQLKDIESHRDSMYNMRGKIILSDLKTDPNNTVKKYETNSTTPNIHDGHLIYDIKPDCMVSIGTCDVDSRQFTINEPLIAVTAMYTFIRPLVDSVKYTGVTINNPDKLNKLMRSGFEVGGIKYKNGFMKILI
jgi:hypothetical protein